MSYKIQHYGVLLRCSHSSYYLNALIHHDQGRIRSLGFNLFQYLESTRISSHFIPSHPQQPGSPDHSKCRGLLWLGAYNSSREGMVPKMLLVTSLCHQLYLPWRCPFFCSLRLLFYVRGSDGKKPPKNKKPQQNKTNLSSLSFPLEEGDSGHIQ